MIKINDMILKELITIIEKKSLDFGAEKIYRDILQGYLLHISFNYANYVIDVVGSYQINEEPYEEETDERGATRSFGGSSYYEFTSIDELELRKIGIKGETVYKLTDEEEKQVINAIGELLVE